jgi:EAL domain-containing protein (putative c-di-GMP-specific phosphodiesterase class I)
VERQEQVDFLLAEGCAEVQGFLFGRPLPLADIAQQVGRAEEAPPQKPVAEAAPALSAAEAA